MVNLRFKPISSLLILSVMTLCGVTIPKLLFSQKPESRGQEDYKLVVDINLVEIQAVVTTPNGALVPNLNKEDFQLFEDGKEQQIAFFSRELNQPLNLCLLFDASGSVLIELKTEQEAALEFLKRVIRPVDRVSIYQVSDEVDELVHSSNRTDLFASALRSIKTGGATSLYDAVYLAAQSLAPLKGPKVIVIITDGDDTTSDINLGQCILAAQNSGSVVYPLVIQPIKTPVGINLAGQHAMIYLAEKTGGKYFPVPSMASLQSSFNDLSAELRTLYVLGYYPDPVSPDRIFHQIEVKASNPQFKVRHREGYSMAPVSRSKKPIHK